MGIIWCHLCPTPSNRPLWKRKLICTIRFLKPHQLHQCHLECNPRATLLWKKVWKNWFYVRTFSTSWWPWFFWAEYEAESGTLDSVSSTITGGLLCWGNVGILLASEGLKFVLSRLFSKTASNLLGWPSEWAVVPNHCSLFISFYTEISHLTATCPIDWILQLLHLVDALHGSLKRVSEDILRWWTLVVDSTPHFTTESSHGITEVLETCLSYGLCVWVRHAPPFLRLIRCRKLCFGRLVKVFG